MQGCARLFVYIQNLVPRGTHSRWNQQATDLPKKRGQLLANTNNAKHNIIDVLKNNDNGIKSLPLKLAVSSFIHENNIGNCLL